MYLLIVMDYDVLQNITDIAFFFKYIFNRKLKIGLLQNHEKFEIFSEDSGCVNFELFL